MASNNPDLKELVIRNVEFKWPKLDQTYRYDASMGRSEPCPQTATGAAWSVSWDMGPKEAKEFHSVLKAHYEECRARDRKLPEFSTVFGFRKNEDGGATFSAKRRGTNAKGAPNRAPTMVDGAKVEITDRAIWGGSRGSVRVLAFPTKSPTGEGGVSMILDGVQVTEAVYGGADGGRGFDTYEPEAAAPAAAERPPEW